MGTSCVMYVEERVIDHDWDAEGHPVTESVGRVAACYRHFDGYPDGMGLDIAQALGAASMSFHVKNNRNWAQGFLARLCAQDMDLEFYPAGGVGDEVPVYADFCYVVRGSLDVSGGKESTDPFESVEVAVYGCNASHLGEEMFRGGWRGLMTWCLGLRAEDAECSLEEASPYWRFDGADEPRHEGWKPLSFSFSEDEWRMFHRVVSEADGEA